MTACSTSTPWCAPGDPARLRPFYDSRHLHLNDVGYRAIADTMPVEAFR